jgi:hypothetical protein
MIKGHKPICPTQDCEDCAVCIANLGLEFTKPTFKTPFLQVLQACCKDWIFYVALSGVHGQQFSDREKDIMKEDLGGHLFAGSMRKVTLCKMVSAINKSLSLFEGWSKYEEQARLEGGFTKEDSHLLGEGTNEVDPDENDYHSNLLPGYRAVVKNSIGQSEENPRGPFRYWRFVQWEDRSKEDPFYAAVMQTVFPELYDHGLDVASFSAISKSGNEWDAGISYREFMKPHSEVALRMDPPIPKAQAKAIERVLSFYPPMTGFKVVGEAKDCPVRSRFVSRMKNLETEFTKLNRPVYDAKSPETQWIPFNCSYFAIEQRIITDVMKTVANNPHIVGLRVIEEPISAGLGGFEVKFQVHRDGMTSMPIQTPMRRKHQYFLGEKALVPKGYVSLDSF